MSNGFEIAGSCLNAAGAIWLLVDAVRIRRNIRAEDAATQLREILNGTGAGKILTDKKGNQLDSDKALRLWFSAHTIAWNWVALGIVSLGFVFDLYGKLRG
jgi:hypothetical protein